MKKYIVVATFIFSTVAAQALDNSWFQKANFGAGKKSCSEWLKDKSNRSARNEDVAWVLGYLSADATRHPTAERDLVPEDVPAELDSMCAEQPDIDLREATRGLAIKHGLEPMPD
jgi:hypothetical protein